MRIQKLSASLSLVLVISLYVLASSTPRQSLALSFSETRTDSGLQVRGSSDVVSKANGTGLETLNNTLKGTTDDDTLKGENKTIIFGLDGNDHITGSNSSNAIFAGPGDDVVIDGDNASKIFGATGDDEIEGRGGDDVLDGGTGSDKLIGDAGNDLLIGTNDEDIFTGGSGVDIFECGPGRDTVTDYNATDDILDDDCEIVHSVK